MIMNWQPCFFVLLGILSPAMTSAEQTNAFQVTQQAFQKQEQALLDTYDQALSSRMTELKRKGDLDSYLTTDAEKKRLNTEKTVPLPVDSTNVAALAYHKARLGLLKKQVEALDDCMKAETKADRIDTAKQAKAERDCVASEVMSLETKLLKNIADMKHPKPIIEQPKPIIDRKLTGRPGVREM